MKKLFANVSLKKIFLFVPYGIFPKHHILQTCNYKPYLNLHSTLLYFFLSHFQHSNDVFFPQLVPAGNTLDRKSVTEQLILFCGKLHESRMIGSIMTQCFLTKHDMFI